MAVVVVSSASSTSMAFARRRHHRPVILVVAVVVVVTNPTPLKDGSPIPPLFNRVLLASLEIVLTDIASGPDEDSLLRQAVVRFPQYRQRTAKGRQSKEIRHERRQLRRHGQPRGKQDKGGDSHTPVCCDRFSLSLSGAAASDDVDCSSWYWT